MKIGLMLAMNDVGEWWQKRKERVCSIDNIESDIAFMVRVTIELELALAAAWALSLYGDPIGGWLLERLGMAVAWCLI